jgi:hypothetical protein
MTMLRNDYNHENKSHNGICDWGHGYDLWHLECEHLD